jgi:hypothetical protein
MAAADLSIVPVDLFRAVEVDKLGVRQIGLPEYVVAFEPANNEVQVCDEGGVPCALDHPDIFALPNTQRLVANTSLPGLSLRSDEAEHAKDFDLQKARKVKAAQAKAAELAKKAKASAESTAAESADPPNPVDLRTALSSAVPAHIKVPAADPTTDPLSLDAQFPAVLAALQATLLPSLTSLAIIRQKYPPILRLKVVVEPAEKKEIAFRAWFCYKLPAGTQLPPGFEVFNDLPAEGHFSLFPTRLIPITQCVATPALVYSPALYAIPQWQLHCFLLKASAKPQDLKDDDHGGCNPLHRVATLIYEHFHQLPEGDVDLALHVQEMLAQVQYRPSRVTPDGLAHVRRIVVSLRCTDADVDGLVFEQPSRLVASLSLTHTHTHSHTHARTHVHTTAFSLVQVSLFCCGRGNTSAATTRPLPPLTVEGIRGVDGRFCRR